MCYWHHTSLNPRVWYRLQAMSQWANSNVRFWPLHLFSFFSTLKTDYFNTVLRFAHVYPVDTLSSASLLPFLLLTFDPCLSAWHRMICTCIGCSHTSNTWMLREVTKRATPMPMKAKPMRTKPGMTMPAESMGCHAGSLCWVKAVLSGRLANSCSVFTIFLALLDRLLISSVFVMCTARYFKCISHSKHKILYIKSKWMSFYFSDWH